MSNLIETFKKRRQDQRVRQIEKGCDNALDYIFYCKECRESGVKQLSPREYFENDTRQD